MEEGVFLDKEEREEEGDGPMSKAREGMNKTKCRMNFQL